MEDVREKCKEYALENIFNVDETGIFYRWLPNRTSLSKEEKRKTVKGKKGMEVKDRVSAYMYRNATGFARVPMSIMGKSVNPRCFHLRHCPKKYFSQSNAWSDSSMFSGSGGARCSSPSVGDKPTPPPFVWTDVRRTISRRTSGSE